jgi:hypothetical protein
MYCLVLNHAARSEQSNNHLLVAATFYLRFFVFCGFTFFPALLI